MFFHPDLWRFYLHISAKIVFLTQKLTKKIPKSKWIFAKILKCHNLQHYLGRDRLSQMVTVNVGIVYHLALPVLTCYSCMGRWRRQQEGHVLKYMPASETYCLGSISGSMYQPFICTLLSCPNLTKLSGYLQSWFFFWLNASLACVDRYGNCKQCLEKGRSSFLIGNLRCLFSLPVSQISACVDRLSASELCYCTGAENAKGLQPISVGLQMSKPGQP